MRRTISAVVAGASLLVCVLTPVAYFRGSVEEQTFHWLFVLASVGWFVAAATFVSGKK